MVDAGIIVQHNGLLMYKNENKSARERKTTSLRQTNQSYFNKYIQLFIFKLGYFNIKNTLRINHAN